MPTIQTVVFDTKSYDREPLQRASTGSDIEWRFMDCRLTAETANAAHGARAHPTHDRPRHRHSGHQQKPVDPGFALAHLP